MGAALQLVGTPQKVTMTSREIADLVESRHDKVKQSIERLAARSLIAQPPMGDEQFDDAMGRHRKESVYHIGKRDSYVVVAQLSPEFTARLVDRWQELESQQPATLDLNNPIALRAALLSYSERVIELDNKIAADAPKVAFAEAVRSIDGVCHIEKIAKTLGIGRNKFFKRLRDDGILMGTNMPYQKYIDREYFTVIEQAPYTDKEGVKHPTFTPMVTGAGQVFLARKYSPVAAARG
jgi:phage antirepressor YoqD-like protein